MNEGKIKKRTCHANTFLLYHYIYKYVFYNQIEYNSFKTYVLKHILYIYIYTYKTI